MPRAAIREDDTYVEDFEAEDDEGPAVPSPVSRASLRASTPSVRSSGATDASGTYASETASALGSEDLVGSSVESLQTVRQSIVSEPEQRSFDFFSRNAPVSQSLAEAPRPVRSSWDEGEIPPRPTSAATTEDEVTAFDISTDDDPPAPALAASSAPAPRRLAPIGGRPSAPSYGAQADPESSTDTMVESIELP